METGIGGDKGPSSVRKDNGDPATGIESAKGSSPDVFASSGAYAGKSPRGSTNWGDLEETIVEKDSEDPKEKSEDGNITSHIAEIYSYYNDKDERADDQKDSDFPHAGVKLSKKDKEGPKEGDEDSGVTTDEDDDKPQNGNTSSRYDPDPASLSTSYDLLLKDYDEALADRKIILNDKSLSEEVRIVHLRKSKVRIEDLARELWARNPPYFPPDESAAALVSAPRDNTQASLSDEDEYLQCIARGKAIQERIAAREILAKTQSSSSNTDEDWNSLSATFDRAANKPGAFQGITNCLDIKSALEPPAARRIVERIPGRHRLAKRGPS